MSKKSAMIDKKTGKRPLQELTRKQQVAALRSMKTQEIAGRVAENIQEAVKQEVELQLATTKDAVFDLIDTVVKLEKEVYGDEGDSADRQSGTEAPEVPFDSEVVQGSGIEGSDDCGPDREGGS